MILCVFFTMFFVMSCTGGSNGGDNDDCDPQPVPRFFTPATPVYNDLVGEFIRATATSSIASLHPAVNAANDSGMEGWYGRLHTHTPVLNDAAAATTTWLTRPHQLNNEIIFDFNQIDSVGKIYVWNFNQLGNTDSGLRNIKIYYSVDGETWSLKRRGTNDIFTLARAPESSSWMSATNLYGSGLPIDMGGVPARFVRFVPEQVNGSWGSTSYGLSQVRFYRFRAEPVEGGIIDAVPLQRGATAFRPAVTRTHQYSPAHVVPPFPVGKFNLINSLGISDMTSANAVVSNDPSKMWLMPTGSVFMEFDLVGTYPLGQIAFWNYNAQGATEYGLRNIRIQTSMDGTSWSVAQNVELTRATGQAGMGATDIIDMDNITARYVRITVAPTESTWGGDRFGLAKIRFFMGSGWMAQRANDWTATMSVFNRTWGGADGTYFVRMDGLNGHIDDPDLPDTKFIVSFADTLLGVSDPVTGVRSRFNMPNNTFAIFDGNCVESIMANRTFYHHHTGVSETPNATNILHPPSWAGYPSLDYYWLGGAMVIGDHYYVFLWHVHNTGGVGLGFEMAGTDLARFDICRVTNTVDFANPFYIIGNDRTSVAPGTRFPNGKVSYGRLSHEWSPAPGRHFIYFAGGTHVNTENAGAINPDGYVYIYGTLDNNGRFGTVARVPEAYVSYFEKYQFWTGTEWSSDIRDSGRIANSTSPSGGAIQITYGEHAGRFLFGYQFLTQSDRLMVAMADNPWGPFTEATTVFGVNDHRTTRIHQVPMPEENPNDPNEPIRWEPLVPNTSITYGAKLQPFISRRGEMLMSYNLNAGGTGSINMNNGNLYHSRFITLRMIPSRTS